MAGLITGFSSGVRGSWWLYSAGIVFGVMIAVSIAYSGLKPYRALKGDASTRSTDSAIAWYDDAIAQEKDAYGKRTSRRRRYLPFRATENLQEGYDREHTGLVVVQALFAAVVVLLVIARVTSAADERPSVLRLMDRARSALLGNRAHEACSLLTRHGRRQALGFRVDFNRGLPRTCVAMVKREWKEAHIPRVNVSWPSDLRHSSFTVVRLHGAAASVRLRVRKPYGPRVHFRLRKTSEGWRIDDSDAVPQGH